MSTTNDSTLIRLIRRHLDSGLAAIPQEKTTRLQRARELALSKQKQAGWMARMVGAGISLHLDFFAQRALARFTALLVVTGAMAFWHAQSYVVELEELDSAILTDEMPMDVITDKGFNEWLQASAER
jgi:hypothetical protein